MNILIDNFKLNLSRFYDMQIQQKVQGNVANIQTDC